MKQACSHVTVELARTTVKQSVLSQTQGPYALNTEATCRELLWLRQLQPSWADGQMGLMLLIPSCISSWLSLVIVSFAGLECLNWKLVKDCLVEKSLILFDITYKFCDAFLLPSFTCNLPIY